jgi:hypothetical protein
MIGENGENSLRGLSADIIGFVSLALVGQFVEPYAASGVKVGFAGERSLL